MYKSVGTFEMVMVSLFRIEIHFENLSHGMVLRMMTALCRSDLSCAVTDGTVAIGNSKDRCDPRVVRVGVD